MDAIEAEAIIRQAGLPAGSRLEVLTGNTHENNGSIKVLLHHGIDGPAGRKFGQALVLTREMLEYELHPEDNLRRDLYKMVAALGRAIEHWAKEQASAKII
ncbi:MAG: hypothetical protein KJ954_14165 [Alphaproteobacteria bacterium]|nr:hypothetical protein [Alphaproteobacteria bacterium]